MKLVFYSLVLNHHQACVADEFYKLLGEDYAFVETARCMDNKGATEDYSLRPYLLRSWKSKEDYENAISLALQAKVCVFGGYEALPFQKARMSKGLLSFDMGERILKRGWFNLASPRIFKMVMAYHLGGWSKKPLYKLCSSAFAARDQYKLKSFKDKSYKWGYFTEVKDIKDDGGKLKAIDEPAYLMWCARFIDWKHPEMAVKLAKKLQDDGYNFQLNMYGTGEMRPTIQKLIEDLRLSDRVCLKGIVPNDDIQQAMANHDIFLFTSDKREGWGAVANEAMSNKCCLVGSDEIGAIPYLVKNGLNGMVFKSKSLDSLNHQVKYLLDYPDERRIMAKRGYQDMVRLWNPKHAAESLLILIKDIQNKREISIQEGPCSKA